MMADKENDDFEANLKNMGLEGGASDSDIDALLAADGEGMPSVSELDEEQDEGEEFIDFNDFSIDDLDTALSKYEAVRSGKSSPVMPNVAEAKAEETAPVVGDNFAKSENPGTEVLTAEDDVLSDLDVRPSETPRFDAAAANNGGLFTRDGEISKAPVSTVAELMQATRPVFDNVGEFEADLPMVEEPQNSAEEAVNAMPAADSAVSPLEEKLGGHMLSEEERQALGNLIWYDGQLGEKVYEISLNNMPEFLDYDKNVKTIHVNIDSPYGWNVFFENGVFMNLMDLKEYQERNGSLPGTNGKIIYGNRMSSFEKIERIVVYEKPRYFSYGLKK